MGERHLLRMLAKYVEYYNETRTHLSLAKDAATPRTMQPPSQGRVIEVPRVGWVSSWIHSESGVNRRDE